MAALFLGTFSMSNAQAVKLDRKEKKEVRKAQLTANFYALDTLLKARSFVLEADFLQNNYGDRVPVSSNLNFIMVNKSNGVLQTGSNMSIGYNGVGGVTAEGNIGSWELNRDAKRLYHTLRFSLLSNIGHYDVFLTVNADNNASAIITGLGRGSLTWNGRIKTLNGSRVFKGQTTY